MAIVIEHEKRKREILNKSLDIFIEEGFEDVTFQKIADRCGITRTTLYLYFRDKREIFTDSIRQLTSLIESRLKKIIRDVSLSATEKLHATMNEILDAFMENRKLFTVLLNYLIQLQKAGKDAGERVRRRIIRLRHILSNLINEGIASGEFRPVNVHDADEMLYGLLESAIFRLSVLNQQNLSEIRSAINQAVTCLGVT
ncbi:MAG: TetR/AcrR family transcriptional regulator [Treponema sp.]|jgi:AcrR family transcriptional regulator|nr:TetR/AcrR family transcriptional regulator [Treponema sp.]